MYARLRRPLPRASRPPRSWNGDGEVLGVVPLLRAEGCEEEAQVGLVLPEDVRPSEAESRWELAQDFVLPLRCNGSSTIAYPFHPRRPRERKGGVRQRPRMSEGADGGRGAPARNSGYGACYPLFFSCRCAGSWERAPRQSGTSTVVPNARPGKSPKVVGPWLVYRSDSGGTVAWSGRPAGGRGRRRRTN